MYKTVRHGENSLQYTILPQTEEVLSNSGLKGKGRDYSPSIHVRRTRRRSTLKYVLLVIFGLVVALMLAAIPICVMNGALYSRRIQLEHHESMTSAPLTPTGREIVKSRKKELKMYADILSTLKSKLETSTTTSVMSTSTAAPPPLPVDHATTPPWTMPALRSWKSSSATTTTRTIPLEHNDINYPQRVTERNIAKLDSYISAKPWEKDIIIKPTVTAEPVTLRNILYRHYRTSVPSVKTMTADRALQDVLITTRPSTSRIRASTEAVTSENSKWKDLKNTLLSVDDDEEFKEALEVDEALSLPPLKPASMGQLDGDEVTVAKAGGGWYGARWPFVDTSSYFQWTGYSPGDNLLLPLLVAALSSVALVLLLALAVRRRKRTQAGAGHIGLSSDPQADDNTNLLAETAEEPEE